MRKEWKPASRTSTTGYIGERWPEAQTEAPAYQGQDRHFVFVPLSAQPSRRVYIPKSDGRQRPLGISALEDKVVQQAVAAVLSQIYEGDFAGFSYLSLIHI